MSSSSSYGSYTQDKGAYMTRPSTSTTYPSTSSSSLHTNSGYSSRSQRYSKPPIIHNGGGQSNDPNTSTSAPNSGYYT